MDDEYLGFVEDDPQHKTLADFMHNQSSDSLHFVLPQDVKDSIPAGHPHDIAYVSVSPLSVARSLRQIFFDAIRKLSSDEVLKDADLIDEEYLAMERAAFFHFFAHYQIIAGYALGLALSVALQQTLGETYGDLARRQYLAPDEMMNNLRDYVKESLGKKPTGPAKKDETALGLPEFVYDAWNAARSLIPKDGTKANVPVAKQVRDKLIAHYPEKYPRLTLTNFYSRLKEGGLAWSDMQKRLVADFDSK